jgi:hypothetical protein
MRCPCFCTPPRPPLPAVEVLAVDGVRRPYGVAGFDLGQLKMPTSVAVIPGYGVFVVERFNERVQLLSSVVITSQPRGATLAVGDAATFAVSTAGEATGLTFVWTKDGEDMGVNAPNVTYTATQDDAGTQFSIVCEVTHAVGRAVSEAAVVVVPGVPSTVPGTSSTLSTGGAIGIAVAGAAVLAMVAVLVRCWQRAVARCRAV